MELYERWRDTCAENRGAWAIREEATGKSWTFGELDEAVRGLPRIKVGRSVPNAVEGGAVAFVVKTLQAWRDGAVLVPMERAFEWVDDSEEVPEGVVHIKTTSGSTGEPRRVYFEASQLVADCEQIWETMGLQRTAPNLGVISMAHSYGFSNLVLPMLLKGMPMIALGDPLPGTLRRAFAEMGKVTLPAVPAMWRAWHQAGVLLPANIYCAITAGAPMPLDLEISIFDRAGLKVHNFYGSSECGGIAYDSTSTPRESADLAGRAMKGVALKICDDGCLEVQSAAVARSYDGASESLSGGVFRTTDLARLRNDTVYLEGRLTDTIHIAGRKVSPQVIEAALLRCPGVRYCVVFGVASSDATRVEEIVACVNMDEGMSHEALQTEIGKMLPSWQVPRRWWKTSQVLPDERGKLPRALWRERFLGVTVH
jgi:long-chain acyl-CoA synthetase